MKYKVARSDDQVVFQIVGALDASTAPKIERSVLALIGEFQAGSAAGGGQRIGIDLSGCDLLAAAGISLLLRVQAKAHSAGIRLHIGPLSEQARRTIDMAFLGDTFTAR